MAGFFSKEKVINKVLSVPVDRIHPNPSQPRLDFDRESLAELAESIRENGVLQPITLRKMGDGYELIAGERRLRAAKSVGKTEIPAVVVDSTGQQSAVYAILENIQREDLNIFEEARALKVLIHEWGVTQEEAARKLGKAQSTVANKLRLLVLTEREQKFILDNGLTERHARALLKVPEEERRCELLELTVQNRWNVSQLEAAIEKPLQGKPEEKQRIFIVKDVRVFLNTINKAIDTMKRAGIPAEADKQEGENCIEYRVRIPLMK